MTTKILIALLIASPLSAFASTKVIAEKDMTLQPETSSIHGVYGVESVQTCSFQYPSAEFIRVIKTGASFTVSAIHRQQRSYTTQELSTQLQEIMGVKIEPGNMTPVQFMQYVKKEYGGTIIGASDQTSIANVVTVAIKADSSGTQASIVCEGAQKLSDEQVWRTIEGSLGFAPSSEF